MECPVDGTTLALAERHGVEIDYCPECRGVSLYRGELDKILDGAGRQADHVSRDGHDHSGHHDHDDRSSDGHDYDERTGQDGRKRRSRFSMLTDYLGGGED